MEKTRFGGRAFALALCSVVVLAAFSGCISEQETTNSISSEEAQSSSNLLENSGFEDMSGTSPDFWFKACVSQSGLSMYLDNSVKHDGKVSACVKNTQAYGYTIANNWAQDVYSADRLIGKTVKLSGWMKSKSADTVNICIQCWSDSSEMVGFASTTEIHGTNEWKEYTASIEVPYGTDKITIRASLGWDDGATGQAWFDDITLTVAD